MPGDHQVIKNAALVIQKQRITDPAVSDSVNISWCQPFQHCAGTWSREADLGHVRDVKQSGRRTGGKMFSLNAVGILDGHVPAGKRHHAGTMREVEVI